MRRALLACVAAFLSGCGGGGATPPRTDEERVDDQAIAADANRALGRVDGVDRLQVRIEVHRGRVTLSGRVRDEAAAKAACDAVGRVKGVGGVVDRLEREK